MPIILNTEPEKVERLEIGDSVILYTRASGDEVERVLRETVNPETGEMDSTAAGGTLMARHVVGWENVLDANGVDVPFSAEFVETFVEALGYGVRGRLDAAITSGYAEAAASGKDSENGSSGTD